MAAFFSRTSMPQTNVYKLKYKPWYRSKPLHPTPTPTPTIPDKSTNPCFSNHLSIAYSRPNPSIAGSMEYLQDELMPKHVAMFMDGHHKERSRLGVGMKSLNDIAQICCELGIRVLSVYKASSGGANEEVDFPMNMTDSDLEELKRNDIRFSVIGNRGAISKSLLENIIQAEEITNNNKTLHIIEAINYSGRWDIIQACIALAGKVEDGLLQPTEIDDNIIQQELQTKCSDYPNPDLMIRTGGRYSLDDYMLWQSAYSELRFVGKHALQFNKFDFIEALRVYQKRNRRFGGK